MNKLLVSDLARMKSALIFWTCVIAMAIYGIIASLNVYLDNGALADEVSAEDVAFGFNMVVGLLCAAFCSIFHVEEYTEGTVRNKLIIGHSRFSVYLSQLIISVISGLAMCAAFTVPALIVGILFLGGFKEMSVFEVVGYYAASVMLTAVCTALFSFISTCIPNRSGSSAVCYVIIFVVILYGIWIHNDLTTPEYTSMFVGGEMIYGLNPRYPDEHKRKILETIFDMLPSGQAYQLRYGCAHNMPFMILSDVIITAVFTLLGMLRFSRKEIK